MCAWGQRMETGCGAQGTFLLTLYSPYTLEQWHLQYSN